MTGSDMGDDALVGFLREHPNIRARVVSMARAGANADGDLGEADAAEERLVEDMRHMGLAATERAIRQQSSLRCQGKKLRWHTKFGDVEVLKPQHQLGTTRVPPSS